MRVNERERERARLFSKGKKTHWYYFCPGIVLFFLPCKTAVAGLMSKLADGGDEESLDLLTDIHPLSVFEASSKHGDEFVDSISIWKKILFL